MPRRKNYKLKHCIYYQNKNGYESGCGYRAAYNKYWHYCPYCGKSIVVINKESNFIDNQK